MNAPSDRRPRLALPFTILANGDTVRLVAGEDFRYTLRGPKLAAWLPQMLKACDGCQTTDAIVAALPDTVQKSARMVIDRLFGERVLVNGTAHDAHQPHDYQVQVEGTGPLVAGLATLAGPAKGAERFLYIFCQDRLDYETAIEFNRRCRKERCRWLWVSFGAMSRGYVSPVFLPDAGPCLTCLIRQFQRLSPAPKIYDDLRAHARQQEPLVPVPFPSEGIEILKQIVLVKLSWLRQNDPPPALYRLNVLEIASMEVTSHRVFRDPQCPDCGEGT
jgi:bacteriocin biosynthesis cyclodehydratase domain-containing protein